MPNKWGTHWIVDEVTTLCRCIPVSEQDWKRSNNKDQEALLVKRAKSARKEKAKTTGIPSHYCRQVHVHILFSSVVLKNRYYTG